MWEGLDEQKDGSMMFCEYYEVCNLYQGVDCYELGLNDYEVGCRVIEINLFGVLCTGF